MWVYNLLWARLNNKMFSNALLIMMNYKYLYLFSDRARVRPSTPSFESCCVETLLLLGKYSYIYVHYENRSTYIFPDKSIAGSNGVRLPIDLATICCKNPLSQNYYVASSWVPWNMPFIFYLEIFFCSFSEIFINIP